MATFRVSFPNASEDEIFEGELTPKWLEKTIKMSIVEPFLYAHKKKPKKWEDVSVEADGEAVILDTLAKSLVDRSQSAEPVHIVITLEELLGSSAPSPNRSLKKKPSLLKRLISGNDYAEFLIQADDVRMQTTVRGATWLNKSLREGLIEPFIETYNSQQRAPISAYLSPPLSLSKPDARDRPLPSLIESASCACPSGLQMSLGEILSIEVGENTEPFQGELVGDDLAVAHAVRGEVTRVQLTMRVWLDGDSSQPVEPDAREEPAPHFVPVKVRSPSRRR